jgi:hypothetical protein
MRGESAQIERVSETGTVRRVGVKDVLVGTGLEHGDGADWIPDRGALAALLPQPHEPWSDFHTAANGA